MKLVDFAMNCCGVVTAEEISLPLKLYRDENGYEVSESDEQRKERWDALFQKIEEHQKKYKRNLALMTLVYSSRAKREAENRGWKVLHTFYNPNTTLTLCLMGKEIWSGYDDYREQVNSGKYVPPKLSLNYASSPQGVFEYEV